MNRITSLFNIKYPIIQGGMVWCSGWRLASAVSNQGGLGLLGAGSMHPETLIQHIHKLKAATDKPWGINIPLLYPEIEKIMDIVVKEHVKIVFTSAGSPRTWTSFLQSKGIIVVHVVSSTLFAKKCEDAGCNAIVAEGFEAGGHNGRDETTTLTLIPSVAKECSLPIIAAGGIASGKAMLAAMTLGADGVQIGTRFAVASESSAHPSFKKLIYETHEGGTMLTLKKLTPTRLVKNSFYTQIKQLEDIGADQKKFQELLSTGRTKKGIFEGDIENGEIEIGQIASMLNYEENVETIFHDILTDYEISRKKIIESPHFQL